MDTKLMIGSSALDRFFVECTLSGANFCNEETAHNAKKIADKYSLTYKNGIEMLYCKAYENHMNILKLNGLDIY